MYYYALLIKNLSEISSNDYPQISLSLFVKFFEIPFDDRDTFKIHPANNEPSFFFNATASNWKQQRSNKMNANLRSSFFEKKFLKSTENSPIKSWTRDPNNFHRVIKREIVEEDNRFFFFFFEQQKDDNGARIFGGKSDKNQHRHLLWVIRTRGSFAVSG